MGIRTMNKFVTNDWEVGGGGTSSVVLVSEMKGE
jgi:hypothetical protein